METKLRRFVEEDVGHGDVTTFCTVPFGTVAEAEVIAKEEGVIVAGEGHREPWEKKREPREALDSSGLSSAAYAVVRGSGCP